MKKTKLGKLTRGGHDKPKGNDADRDKDSLEITQGKSTVAALHSQRQKVLKGGVTARHERPRKDDDLNRGKSVRGLN